MIDMSKAEHFAGAGGFNAEHPVVCRLGSPLKGVSVAAQHDDVVTDLDIPLSGPFRLASASKDGTVSRLTLYLLSSRSLNVFLIACNMIIFSSPSSEFCCCVPGTYLGRTEAMLFYARTIRRKRCGCSVLYIIAST